MKIRHGHQLFVQIQQKSQLSSVLLTQKNILILAKGKKTVSITLVCILGFENSDQQTFYKIWSQSWSLFVCLFVLRFYNPVNSNGVMSSMVSLPNHTFTGQAQSSK